MKFGVTQWTLDKTGFDALERAAELGFAQIQVDAGGWGDFPDFNDPATKKTYAQASADTGVEIVGVACNLFNEVSLTDASADHTDLITQIVMNVGDVAPLIYVASFNASEMKSDADMTTTARWLRLFCEVAQQTGITIATENTLDAAGHQKLFDAVDHPDLRVLIDTQNPVIWGHNTSEIVKAVQPRLSGQFHAKDGFGEVMGNAPLGQGDMRFLETVETVKSLGVEGIWISENEYGEDTEARVKHDMNVLRTQLG